MMTSGTFTIYDPAYPSKPADTTTLARATAVALEDTIRRDGLETGAFIAADGRVVIQKTGRPNQVTFGAHELLGTDRTLFTHNHPDGDTFSREDIVAAIQSDLIEVRAVGPTLRHFMWAPGGWPPEVALDRAIAKAIAVAQAHTGRMINTGQLDQRHAPREVTHQLWREVARMLSLRYEREKS